MCLLALAFTFGYYLLRGPTLASCMLPLGKSFAFFSILVNPVMASWVSRIRKSVNYFSNLSVTSWFYSAFLTNINKILRSCVFRDRISQTKN